MGAALKSMDTLDTRKGGLVEMGATLKRARQEFQLSLGEVASQIKVSEAQLRALEEGNWEALPAEVYARGYVRKYAEFLGLDHTMLFAYLHPSTPPLELVKTPVIHKSSVRIGFHPLFILLLLIATAIATALLYQPVSRRPQPIIKSVPDTLIAYEQGHSMHAIHTIPACLQERLATSLWSCYLPLRLTTPAAYNPYIHPLSLLP
jgi:transcriptional regulator with XRE-family HTH domain